MAEIQFLIPNNHSTEVVIRIIPETYEGIHIHDEHIVCSNCAIEIMENDGDKLCDLLDKGLCKKCDRLITRLVNSKNALEKKKQQIVNLEYKLYTAKHLKC